MRSPWEWLLRVFLGAAAVVFGWFIGTEVGLLAGLAIDNASPDEVFVSAALLTIPIGGLTGSAAGLWLAYRILRRAPPWASALLAGFVVFALLFRGSGTAAIPPTCYSLFGYVVPCEPWLAWAAGAATAGVVVLVLWMNDRRRQ